MWSPSLWLQRQLLKGQRLLSGPCLQHYMQPPPGTHSECWHFSSPSHHTSSHTFYSWPQIINFESLLKWPNQKQVSLHFALQKKVNSAGWACGIKFWGPDSKRQRWGTEVTLTQGSQPNLTGYWLNCWIERVRWCWLFSFVLLGKLGVLISFASFLTRSNVPSVTWKPPSDFQVWLLPDCEIDGCPGIPSRLIWGKTDIATATGCLS